MLAKIITLTHSRAGKGFGPVLRYLLQGATWEPEQFVERGRHAEICHLSPHAVLAGGHPSRTKARNKAFTNDLRWTESRHQMGRISRSRTRGVYASSRLRWVGPGAITGTITVVRKGSGASRTYQAGSGTPWLVELEADLRAGTFG